MKKLMKTINQLGDILSKMTNDMDKMLEAIQGGLLKLFVAIGTL